MHRSHTCGELRLEHAGQTVTLAGWVQKTRDLGHFVFIDLRDRYGITQINVSSDDKDLYDRATSVGREFVLKVTGKVVERESKNSKLPTGNIEIVPESIEVLNASKTPPFMIADETDGLDPLRMQYRYLDLRRKPLQDNLILRHKMGFATREYLNSQGFLEIETPYLIKSTPEGARDFVVPSRMNPGQFYALPQSPQTFKQILMVAGYDKYFQIVRCFRDEDLRGDRQPEFTQIDCEMAFVERDDILNTFEGLTKHLFKEVKGIELDDFPRMSYVDAIARYGSDKPDIRFGLELNELTDIAQHREFSVFNSQEYIGGICIEGGAANYSRKDIDKLTDWVRRPQIGAKGMVWVKWEASGFSSSVKKFYEQEDFQAWMERAGGKEGDLMLILSGDKEKTQNQLGELRKEMGTRLGLRNPDVFQPLWVLDFPLLEWDEDSERYHAMHHPFTSPKPDQLHLLETDPGAIYADAYDLTLNGNEIGGGSIRIHDRALQAQMFKVLGFTKEEAEAQFGFLMGAFEFGAPPHGGIAFGFDRMAAIFGGDENIRDYMAFPKNNSGRDTMIDSPSPIADDQLDELFISLNEKLLAETDNAE